MRVTTVETPELGNRSYVVDDGTSAVVVDVQRDLDRFEPVLADLPDVGYVLETHVHNDYVTGGLELARRTGAAYGVNAADPVAFDRLPLSDGQVLRAGSLEVTVLATPGHTDTHLSYLVTSASPGVAPVLLSGGSLLYGSVGRTDLLGPDRTRELTLAQLRTARRLGALPAATVLLPTHGFGSFCSTGPVSGATASTVGDEAVGNPALTAVDEEEFVASLIAGLGAYPAYYAHMAPLNLAGPGPVPSGSSGSSAVDASTVRAMLQGGGAVVDLRPGPAYAEDHVAGTLSIPLGGQFATYAGWLTPWGAPLVLVAESVDDLDEARRQLARIGIEDAAGSTDGVAEIAGDGKRASFPRRTFADLARERLPGDVVLDVRRREEHADRHLEGSLNIPLHELDERAGELPRARLWVHCAGGYRAGIAASLLEGRGFDVVHVDDTF
jgi:hydroxyacylglutathione hydrolase